MSLKAFHLFFIVLSAVLAVFFAAWGSGQYRLQQDLAYVAVAVIGGLSAAGLVVYAVRFRRKMAHL